MTCSLAREALGFATLLGGFKGLSLKMADNLQVSTVHQGNGFLSKSCKRAVVGYKEWGGGFFGRTTFWFLMELLP